MDFHLAPGNAGSISHHPLCEGVLITVIIEMGSRVQKDEVARCVNQMHITQSSQKKKKKNLSPFLPLNDISNL